MATTTAHERSFVHLIRRYKREGREQLAQQVYEHAILSDIDIDRLLKEVPELVPMKVDNRHAHR